MLIQVIQIIKKWFADFKPYSCSKQVTTPEISKRSTKSCYEIVKYKVAEDI